MMRRCGDQRDVAGVEVEQLGQRPGVAAALAVAGELLDPDGGGVEQLVDDSLDAAAHLGALGLAELGHPVLEAEDLVVDEHGRVRAQGGDGGGDGLGGAGEQVGGHLAGDHLRGDRDLRGGVGAREVLAEVAEPDPGRAGQVGDAEVDVVREGEVDVELRPATAGLEGGAHVVDPDDPGRRPGGGDDDVGAGQALGQPGQRQRRPTDPLGDAARAVVVAVGDDDGVGPGPGGGGGGQRPHPPGPDDEHGELAERAEPGLGAGQPGLHQ